MKKQDVKLVPRVELREDVVSNETKRFASSLFGKHEDIMIDSNGMTFCSEPFPHMVIKDFITDMSETDFLKTLRQELFSLNFNHKSNDLYKFMQSDELMKTECPVNSETCQLKQGIQLQKTHLKTFCELLKNKFLTWLRTSTTVDIDDDINMFCAQYKHTDTLLCHDDELERRRFAYVYYLTEEDWSSSDGGMLDLFSVNSNFEPTTVYKSVRPSFNTLVLFEVSQSSFHQVNEVLSKSKIRLSLSGWFHGAELPRVSTQRTDIRQMHRFIHAQEDDGLLSKWISPQYLSMSTQGSVQEQFEETSEIQLQNFFKTEMYDNLLNALRNVRNEKCYWRLRGPANRRHYFAINKEYFEEVSENSDLNMITEFVNMLRSEEMFLYFSNMTGLSFHPMAVNSSDSEEDSDEEEVPTKKLKSDIPPGVNSKCCYEVGCWSAGDYTLIRDCDDEHGEYALDVNLHLGADDWDLDQGGYISYISQGEDEELLTILPSSNCLSITYRDKDAMRFVKHINNKAKNSYYNISFIYKE